MTILGDRVNQTFSHEELFGILVAASTLLDEELAHHIREHGLWEAWNDDQAWPMQTEKDVFSRINSIVNDERAQRND